MPESVSQVINLEGWTPLLHVAMAVQMGALLMREQLWLRSGLAVGAALLGAYLLLAREPAAGALLVWVGVLFLVNLVMLYGVLRDRMKVEMSEQLEELFSYFNGLEPDEFRRLIRLGSMHRAEQGQTLTVEGEVPDALYFVVVGDVYILKGDDYFMIPDRCFIGEIALLTGKPASATVRLSDGSRYLMWPREKLLEVMKRDQRMSLAVERMLNRDMADKLRRS